METLKSGQLPALVTNIEVMHILSDNIEARNQESEKANDGIVVVQEDQNKKREAGKFRHRDFIEETVYNYLQYTPCAQIIEIEKLPEFVKILKTPPKKKKKKKKTSTGVVDDLAEDTIEVVPSGENMDTFDNNSGGGFGLTDSETLQILNHVPREPVEIHLLIEDLPSRFNDDEQERLLQSIQTHLCTNHNNTNGDEEEEYEEQYEEGEQDVDLENQAYEEGLEDS